MQKTFTIQITFREDGRIKTYENIVEIHQTPIEIQMKDIDGTIFQVERLLIEEIKQY